MSIFTKKLGFSAILLSASVLLTVDASGSLSDREDTPVPEAQRVVGAKHKWREEDKENSPDRTNAKRARSDALIESIAANIGEATEFAKSAKQYHADIIAINRWAFTIFLSLSPDPAYDPSLPHNPAHDRNCSEVISEVKELLWLIQDALENANDAFKMAQKDVGKAEGTLQIKSDSIAAPLAAKHRQNAQHQAQRAQTSLIEAQRAAKLLNNIHSEVFETSRQMSRR